MLANEQVDELICLLATWDRQTLTTEFMAFESNFPLDFTAEFLSELSVDSLRHIFLAMCVQNKRLPVFIRGSVNQQIRNFKSVQRCPERFFG